MQQGRGVEVMPRSTIEWQGIVSTLRETLEDVLLTMELQEGEGIAADIRALEAFDELDRFLSGIKQDLGI